MMYSALPSPCDRSRVDRFRDYATLPPGGSVECDAAWSSTRAAQIFFAATPLFLVACASSPAPAGPALVISYAQPGVPAAVDQVVQRGAAAWSEYGVTYASASSAPACAFDWWNGEPACALRVTVTFDAISTLGGAWGLTYVDERQTILAYFDTLPSLDVAASVAAHELGHELWHDNAHLPAGGVGIMAANNQGYVEPTDDDRAYVDAATGGAR